MKPSSEHVVLQAAQHPFGAAFSIQDLVAAQAWATRSGVGLRVRTDHQERGLHCEEVLRLSRGRTAYNALVWRENGGFVLRVNLGQPMTFARVELALQASCRPWYRRVWSRLSQ